LLQRPVRFRRKKHDVHKLGSVNRKNGKEGGEEERGPKKDELNPQSWEKGGKTKRKLNFLRGFMGRKSGGREGAQEWS